MADLTDEQCDDFRRLPGSFNDMVRAIYRAGRESTATPPADAAIADEIEWPVYHTQGMGCGIEDRGITDRYEACQYGFQEAVDQCAQAFDNWIQTHYLPQTAALRARSVPAADSAALAMLDGYMVVRKELTEQMKFNAAFNLSAQFGEDYAMQHKEFAFAVWDEFKKQAEGMLYEPPPALRARSAPTHNLTAQDTADIARVLCWLKHGDTPPAAEIERIVHRNAELRGIVDALRARAVPEELPLFDAAIAVELPCVSVVPYNSKEICTWFAKNVRERMLAASKSGEGK